MYCFHYWNQIRFQLIIIIWSDFKQDKKVNDAMKRLEELQQRSMDAKESLEDSLVYHEFVKDIHDALLWEEEKIALVSSPDFGKSLIEVQSMMKRHQLLESDIANHNSIVKALAGKGEQVTS